MSEKDCIFCKIVRKEITSKIVFENEYNLAFLDIFPISEGHTVVISKNHYETIEDLPDDELNRLFQAVKQISTLLHDKLNLEGYNIVQNNFKAAGQEVNHFHIHIIPRSFGDLKIRVNISKKAASNEELERVLNKIK